MDRIKKWGVILIVAILVVLPLLGKGLNLYLDWLWFKEVGFEQVLLKILLNKIGLGVIFGLGFFALLWINFWLAKRLSSSSGLPKIGENLLVIPNKEMIAPYINRVLITGSLLFAFFAGSGASIKWLDYLNFLHPTSFGIPDSLFARDIGFYVFQLPFLKYLYYICLFGLVLAALITVGIYIFEEAIHITRRGIRLSPKAKAHFSILAVLLCGLISAGCWVKTCHLLYSPRGVAFGASYVDIHTCLPVLNILSIMCLLTGAMLLLNLLIHKFKWVLFIAGATAGIGIIGLGLLPEIIQKFQIAPNEINMEEKYIRLNIKFTRAAYGLDKTQINKFPAEEGLTSEMIKSNSLTIKNIRLWDHSPLLDTYSQLQEIRTYYKFVDVDNDRYVVDGEYRQVMLSPRELSSEHLPSKVWINEHLTYTHGYGICLGPVNRITPEGLPEFMIKDIPPISTTNLKLSRPETYYGEIGNDYCFVKTKSREFDYPAGDKNVYTTYQGKGGIPINSIWRKALFALKFKEPKILFSTEITNQSRIMIYRRILERVKTITPFIAYDSDPYLVVSEGKLYWVCDGYTLTDMYPYSEPIPQIGNYIRNSVKAVVDAYNGQVQFYVSDKNDPIIQTYTRIFPGLFLPLDRLNEDLRKHLRYPAGMLSVQARMYCTYHMQDPQVFYNKEDLWAVPTKSFGEADQEMQPYYTIMKLAGQEKEEFILMIPFTPAKKDNMIAWLAARCDPPHYGKLLVYNFPKKKLVYGPSQIEARIDQDAEISKLLSLWSQRGSRVIRGSLLVIPIEESLLYIEPLYLAAEKGKIPELKRVIVAFGNKIAMEENLELSLMKIFGEKIGAAAKDQKPQEETAGVTTNQLIHQAADYFRKAEACMQQGDWAAYGQQLDKLKMVLEKLEKEGEAK